MRKLLILLIAGASLAGCATEPVDPWAEIEVEAPGATRPIHCGGFPLPTVVDHDRVVYDVGGIEALEAYRICSEGNEGIAEAHADQVDDMRRAADALVDAGKHQKRIADMRREMLEDERRHMLWERVQYWVVIIAMAAAL